MKNFLTSFAILGVLLVGSYFLVQQTAPKTASATFNPVGAGTYRLGQSIGTSDTSFRLSSFKEPVSGIPYTMGYMNTDIAYATIAPQTSVSEFISFTGVTQNADGSALITGVVRGLPRTPGTGGCVASSTLAQSHAGQSIFILSNSPCFYSEFFSLRTTGTSTAFLVFSSTTPPHYDFNPTFNNFPSTTLASVQYVNSVAFSGAPDASESVKGIVELGTGAQMASSTPLDNTTARLVGYSLYATSSPYTAGNWAVWTMANAKIKQIFLDLTEAFTWTGLHTFTGGLTSTGTTTISAVSTTTNPLKLNGVAYQFPSIRAASSTVLTENGNGALSFNLPDWRLLASTTVTSAVATTTVSWNNTAIGTSTNLRVILDVPQHTGNRISLQFNGDTSASYAWTNFANANAAVTASTVNVIQLTPADSNPGMYVTIDITNPITRTKVLEAHGYSYGTAANAGNVINSGGIYNNTTWAISSISFGETTTIPAGTRIEVYGTPL